MAEISTELNLFRIEWKTGCMEINVDRFFINSPINNVKKFFKLARKNCTDKQRQRLISTLERLIENRNEGLNTLATQYDQYARLLSEFSIMANRAFLYAPEKIIKEQCTKIKKIIQLLSKERWAE